MHGKPTALIYIYINPVHTTTTGNDNMRRNQVAEQAWRVVAEPCRSRPHARPRLRAAHVCMSCMAQHARQLHTTPNLYADIPLYKRMAESIFGRTKKTGTKNASDSDAGTDSTSKTPKKADDGRQRHTTLVQGGVRYEVARSYDAAKDKDYLPATNWKDLERVGSSAWARQRADRGEQYLGFNPRKAQDVSLPYVRDRLVERILHVVHQGIPSSAGERNLAKINLDNPDLKLAVVREASRFIGKRVPDLAVSKAKTAQDILRALQAKEKPKKLRDDPRLQELNESENLPNVKVYGRRRTPVDKEMDIGRWKIIEEELTLRDLPVFGTTYHNAKEGVRLHEKRPDWKKHGYYRHESK